MFIRCPCVGQVTSDITGISPIETAGAGAVGQTYAHPYPALWTV